jgi:hypothetical protein
MKNSIILVLAVVICGCHQPAHETQIRVINREIITLHENYTNNLQLVQETNRYTIIEQNDGQGWHSLDTNNMFFNSETLFRTNKLIQR